jgi:predicted Zn-dependent protease
MNFLFSNRFLNPLLLMMVSAAMIIVLMALSIELLYQAFQFIETALQTSSRQANQYFTQFVNGN